MLKSEVRFGEVAIAARGLGFDSQAGYYCPQLLATAATFLCARPWRWIPPVVTRFRVTPRV